MRFLYNAAFMLLISIWVVFPDQSPERSVVFVSCVIVTLANLIWYAGERLDTPERFRHRRRSGTYRVMTACATVQTERPLVDWDEVVVYQDEVTERYWVRPPTEFSDGRFEKL